MGHASDTLDRVAPSNEKYPLSVVPYPLAAEYRMSDSGSSILEESTKSPRMLLRHHRALSEPR